MKKSKNIKKFFSALCVSLLSVPMLVSCFENNKLPDRPHENENLNDDDVHKIYNDAVRHGFNGSFENWKNTIVGSKFVKHMLHNNAAHTIKPATAPYIMLSAVTTLPAWKHR